MLKAPDLITRMLIAAISSHVFFFFFLNECPSLVRNNQTTSKVFEALTDVRVDI